MCAGYIHISETIYWQQLAAVPSEVPGKRSPSDKKPGTVHRYVRIFLLGRFGWEAQLVAFAECQAKTNCSDTLVFLLAA